MTHLMRPRAASLMRQPATTRERKSSLPPLDGGQLASSQHVPIHKPVVLGSSKLAKSINTHSLKQIFPKTVQPSIPTVKYTIRILSNWGDPSMVSCGEIVPIDSNRHQIQVVSINATPHEAAIEDLNRLVDGSVYRSNQFWKSSYPLRIPIEISICVPSENKPKIFRVLNVQSETTNSGIKEMEIYEEEVQVWKGEIPIDLAFVCHLQTIETNNNDTDSDSDDFLAFHKKQNKMRSNSTLISSARPDSYNKIFSPLNDNFGIIPQIPTSQITIEFLNSYGNETTFGLSGIELLTTKKEVVQSENIEDIKISNGTFTTHPSLLFRGHYMDPKLEDMSIFDRISPDKNPQLMIHLKNPLTIGAIKFWNFFPSDTNELPGNSQLDKYIAVKNISIRLDDNFPVYEGRLKQGDGTIKHLNGSLTTVFLNDMDYKVLRAQGKNHPSSIPLPFKGI